MVSRQKGSSCYVFYLTATNSADSISAGALAMLFGVAVSGKSDRLRNQCCKSVVVGGQQNSSFPSNTLLSREVTSGCCAVLRPILFALFHVSALSTFAQILPLYCPTIHTSVPQAPLFSTTCLAFLWFLCCSVQSVLFSSHPPPSYAQTSKWGMFAAQHRAMGVGLSYRSFLSWYVLDGRQVLRAICVISSTVTSTIQLEILKYN